MEKNLQNKTTVSRNKLILIFKKRHDVTDK
jgi:hypothetical protein